MLLYYWNSRYRGDKVTFKKLIIILTITVSLLITALLGSSYAWYQFDNAVTSFNNVSTYNENIGLAVVFANTSNINTTIGTPIFSEQIDNYSDKTRFSVTTDSSEINGRQIAYQISLVDIQIDELLTENDYLKYSLIEKGNPQPIKSGNFKNFTGDSLVLKEMTTVNGEQDTTYNYEFRLWLEETSCTLEEFENGEYNKCSDQSTLMNKNISGRIKVSSALK